MAGLGWLEGFISRHLQLHIRKPQPLSYCRALCSNKKTMGEFFCRAGVIYGCLNLILKPMLVYNVDKTGLSLCGTQLSEVVASSSA